LRRVSSACSAWTGDRYRRREGLTASGIRLLSGR
jgi:hypothetical protein